MLKRSFVVSLFEKDLCLNCLNARPQGKRKNWLLSAKWLGTAGPTVS